VESLHTKLPTPLFNVHRRKKEKRWMHELQRDAGEGNVECRNALKNREKSKPF
jgi:hypothetical protein